jgi:hypothetical protein
MAKVFVKKIRVKENTCFDENFKCYFYDSIKCYLNGFRSKCVQGEKYYIFVFIKKELT